MNFSSRGGGRRNAALLLLLLLSSATTASCQFSNNNNNNRLLRQQQQRHHLTQFFDATSNSGASFPQCHEQLQAADANDDQALSSAEFATFASSSSSNNESFANLELTFVMAFYTTACSICYSATNGDDQCCVGDRAHIPLDDAMILPSVLDFLCPMVGMDGADTVPTSSPTRAPMVVTTAAPTIVTTAAPTTVTTAAPTTVTTAAPTIVTTAAPTIVTTAAPVVVVPPSEVTLLPTATPTDFPTIVISTMPPTANPTDFPTIVIPTHTPTVVATPVPTTAPPTGTPTTMAPTETPTAPPTGTPTTVAPTETPTAAPTRFVPPPTSPPSATPTPTPPVCISFAYTVETVSATVSAAEILAAQDTTVLERLTLATETIVTGPPLSLDLVSVTIDDVMDDANCESAATVSCVIVASTVCVVDTDDDTRTNLLEGLRVAVDGSSFQDAIPQERRRLDTTTTVVATRGVVPLRM